MLFEMIDEISFDPLNEFGVELINFFSKTSPSTSKQYPKSKFLSLGQVRKFYVM
jgi:hypothetical protein